MFEDNYRAGGRTVTAPFPRDPFGTIREEPDGSRYAIRVRKHDGTDVRLRWRIFCLDLPYDQEALRLDQVDLGTWPIVFKREDDR
jgi:hypothetical protein